MKRHHHFLTLLLLCGCTAEAGGSQGGEMTDRPDQRQATEPYHLPNSEVRTIDSAMLGRSYDLFVRLPPGYSDASNAGRTYPVLFLNDPSCFQTAAGITSSPMLHGGFEHAILVGMSYARGDDGRTSRTRDFTPTRGGPPNGPPSGEARRYLDFLRDEVIPFVEREYRADPQRRILAGQSYGGLFGLFALLEEPGLFHDYILTSASLWFDERVMARMEEDAYRTGRRLSGRVYFAVGATERPAVRGGRTDMVADQQALVATLRSRGHSGLTIRAEVIDGGTHLTTFPVGLTRGLMWLLAGPSPYGG